VGNCEIFVENLDDESEGKTVLKSIVIIKDLKCDTSKNKVWLDERHKHSPRMNTIISINIPDTHHRHKVRAGLNVCIFRRNCYQCGHHTLDIVWNVSSPLGHTETAQCLIGPVALNSLTVQINVKFLCSYCSITD